MGNITQRLHTESADAFINAAADATATKPATAAAKSRMKGNQVGISITMPPELLIKVDEAAESLSISRAAFIKQALTRAVVAERN